MTTAVVDRVRITLVESATNELQQFAAAIGTSTEYVVEEICRMLDRLEREERFARTHEVLRELAAHPSTPYVEEFLRHTKQVAEEKKVAFRAHRQALVERERAGTPPLSARQYPRPIRKGRACGSGWRVRL